MDFFAGRRVAQAKGPGGTEAMRKLGAATDHFTERDADAAMVRYGDGDEAAFAIVYDVIAPLVARFLRRRVRDAGCVDDLLQRTFLQIHRHRARFIPGASVRRWACTIAVRLLISDLGSAKVAQRYLVWGIDADAPSSEADPEASVVGRELYALLEEAIGRLPPTHCRVIQLVRGEGLSSDEAARRLDTTPNGVRIRLSRALAALRTLLRGSEDDRDQ